MPKIRTWDSGRIKKATAAPKTVSKAGKSAIRYAGSRAKAAKAASGRTQDGGAEAAAAELMSDTLSDSAQRFVRKSGSLGHRAGTWGIRRLIQRRRTANAWKKAGQAASPISPHVSEQKIPLPFKQSSSYSPTLSTGKRTGISIRKDKPDIKMSDRSVKRPYGKIRTSTPKMNIKGANATEKAAQAAAKKAAAKAASVNSARAAASKAKQVAAATKEAGIKAIKALMHAARAAVRSLMMLVAAASVPILTALIMICAAASIVGSVFGIFFSSGKGEWTLRSEVKKINQEYEEKIENIRTNTEHDTMHLDGIKATWTDVLAIYSVKMVNDPEDPEEVATMSRKKARFLKKTFWEMNEVTSGTEKITETTVVNGADQQKTYTVLNITTSHKTAWEMADKLNFDEEKRQQLAELLAEDKQDYWNDVLYGIGKGDNNIVSVALSQVGNIGGEPYWSWYGYQGRVPWCACFVSWCADQCGYIEEGIIPKFSGVGTAEDFYKERGQWADRNYVPSPGDIIFFDWAEYGQPDGLTDHVGLVERVADNRVYTIEGNSGNQCLNLSYPLGDPEIYGYGIPQYP